MAREENVGIVCKLRLDFLYKIFMNFDEEFLELLFKLDNPIMLKIILSAIDGQLLLQKEKK